MKGRLHFGEVLHIFKNEYRALRFSVNLKNEIVLSLKVLFYSSVRHKARVKIGVSDLCSA